MRIVIERSKMRGGGESDDERNADEGGVYLWTIMERMGIGEWQYGWELMGLMNIFIIQISG